MSQNSPLTLPEAKSTANGLGFDFPKPASPIAAYVPTRRIGDQILVSGQIPVCQGTLIAEGIVPTQVSVEKAVECAQVCILNAMAAAFSALADGEGLAEIIRIGCFVASTPEFGEHPQIANGASELIVEIFGESGRHARAAVGCSSLPMNAPVEIEMLALAGRI
jgi:enamine deaminase RidA (YjgF/YER057c/UK114 family)